MSNNEIMRETIKYIQDAVSGSSLKIYYLGLCEKISVTAIEEINAESSGRIIVVEENREQALIDFYFKPEAGLKNILKDILIAVDGEKNYLSRYFDRAGHKETKIILDKFSSLLYINIDKIT